MKRIPQICVVLLLSITLFSCSKTEYVLPKQDGQWNIDKQITATTMNDVTTYQTAYDIGIATFTDDGKGSISDNGVVLETFTWDVSGDVITITYDISTTTIAFTILDDSASDYQHWSGSYSYMLGPTEVVIETDLTMSAIK